MNSSTHSHHWEWKNESLHQGNLVWRRTCILGGVAWFSQYSRTHSHVSIWTCCWYMYGDMGCASWCMLDAFYWGCGYDIEWSRQATKIMIVAVVWAWPYFVLFEWCCWMIMMRYDNSCCLCYVIWVRSLDVIVFVHVGCFCVGRKRQEKRT